MLRSLLRIKKNMAGKINNRTENILRYLEVWSEHEFRGIDHDEEKSKVIKKNLPDPSVPFSFEIMDDEKETCVYGNDNYLDSVDPKEWDKVKKINENHL
jgi:hypothetical protein